MGGERAVRAYQRGVPAAIPAAVLASAVTALAGWPSPLEAVAEQIMEWTPVPVAEFLLFHLGSLARPAALLGSLAVIMAVAGLAAAVRAAFGCGPVRVLAGTLVSMGFLAWVYLDLFAPSRPEPALTLVICTIASLALCNAAPRPAPGRRRFLEQNLTVFGGAAVLLTLFSVDPLLRALSVKRFFAFHPARGLRVAGISPLVTPVGSFYQMDKVLQFPGIGPPGWSLEVGGLVGKPAALDYGALIREPAVHRYVTMECVDNPVGGSLMSTALFTGVPLGRVLKRVQPQGDTVVFHSADDYAESLPLRDLLGHDALLVYAMNGEALRRAHGYPLRLIVPGFYGFKSVKWLTHIEVVRGVYHGNWHAHGWSERPLIHTTARIDVARRHSGGITVAGVAFAGIRGIRAVEVRANGGPWRRATLGKVLGPDTWVQWAVEFAGHGRAVIEARAIDGQGHTQTGRMQGAYPSGSTGWARTEA